MNNIIWSILSSKKKNITRAETDTADLVKRLPKICLRACLKVGLPKVSKIDYVSDKNPLKVVMFVEPTNIS